jgi:hypothetical protein
LEEFPRNQEWPTAHERSSWNRHATTWRPSGRIAIVTMVLIPQFEYVGS